MSRRAVLEVLRRRPAHASLYCDTSVRFFATMARVNSRSSGSTGPVVSRAIVFSDNGDPTKVLKGHKYTLPKLKKGEARLRFELSAINPADINVIQGVYPSKPLQRTDITEDGSPLTIMGNEGTAIIEGLVEDDDPLLSSGLTIGERVIMGRSQLSTWQSHHNLPLKSLIPVRSTPALTATQAATLAINPPTAWRMLSDFIPLLSDKQGRHNSKKQWVIQNGANSAVGTSVIQIAKEYGIGTINLVRNRDEIENLVHHLKSLGADHVLTYDQFLKRETRDQIKSWMKESGGEMKLALNCVGGKETTEMVKLLNLEGYLVTYGGMAKVPLSIPPSLFIFKKLHATGFWLSNWVETHPVERLSMMSNLAQMVAEGKLKEPETEIIDIPSEVDAIGDTITEVMSRSEGGKGKKILLRF